MNDLDYIYGKLSNGMITNDVTVNLDGFYNVELKAGLTNATRNQYQTFNGEVKSPGVQVQLVITAIANTAGDPGIMKVGFNLDNTLENVNGEFYPDSYYENFVWFNMQPVAPNKYAIIINESIGRYLKNGGRNTINFVYRVFDINGNEIKHHNPVYDGADKSFWVLKVYKLNVSRSYMPDNIARAFIGYDELRYNSDLEKGFRNIHFLLNQSSFTITDETDWAGVSHLATPIKISQYENVVFTLDLADYWKNMYTSFVVKANIVDPENTVHNVIFRQLYNDENKLQYIFNLRDLFKKGFEIGDENDELTISFSFIPSIEDEQQQEVIIPGNVNIALFTSPDTKEADDVQLKNLLNELALY